MLVCSFTLLNCHVWNISNSKTIMVWRRYAQWIVLQLLQLLDVIMLANNAGRQALSTHGPASNNYFYKYLVTDRATCVSNKFKFRQPACIRLVIFIPPVGVSRHHGNKQVHAFLCISICQRISVVQIN